MATAQMQRNSMSAVIFPNKICTEQQSLILVKRLLAVAVSCITYLRGIFPECAYGTRYLDDLCVKILREDKNCPGSTQLVKWMLGCYDALQKKYTVTECYQFKFKYTNNGPVMDFTSKNKGNDSNITCTDTKKASILLIRKIYVLMQNLGPLPNDICLTMKLFYYDEVTPPDYQPPGFKEGDSDTMIFEGEPIYLNVGEVPTPFHMLKVKVTTERERMENIDKNMLKQGDSKVPTQLIRLDKDDPEEQDQQINEDFVADNKMEVQKNANTSVKVGELSLTCEENEFTRSEESQNKPVSNSQVDQLAIKTSELDVSEGRTRSGKIFQINTAQEHCKNRLVAKCSKETQKRNWSEKLPLSGVHRAEVMDGSTPIPARHTSSGPFSAAGSLVPVLQHYNWKWGTPAKAISSQATTAWLHEVRKDENLCEDLSLQMGPSSVQIPGHQWV
ncbi:wings apart-like protein-like protein [Platysternon megacephalum]|uniref:HORMA domain-containing protein 1 n=1 Tax=Platysternon megacephalum TaxID=55544 RepID=A0A4D9EH77_9SAUR|nr:wings apart-like protein-like protein [Platysternon megacephalum]